MHGQLNGQIEKSNQTYPLTQLDFSLGVGPLQFYNGLVQGAVYI